LKEYTTRNEEPLIRWPTNLILKITNITAWTLINLQAIKNCFIKHNLPVDHVYSGEDNVLKLIEDEENDWRRLQTPGVWLDYDTQQRSRG